MINYLATQKNWQNAFSDTIDDIDELCELLDLNKAALGYAKNSHFALKVPKGFVKKIEPKNPHDPLLKQILPTFHEQVAVAGFVTDPLAEVAANPIKGIIHKYRSRLLIPVTGACMVNCRYCFRQHFDYQDNLPKPEDWQAISDYIIAHPTINEVILSGGDPLALSDRRLFAILSKLEALPQIITIRFHTRVPVVVPERLDTALLERLVQSRCRMVMVIHANHSHELDDETLFYLNRARLAGITLLNQSVLLKGINDDARVLASLSERLWQAGVLPYYLHVLDKVAGAAHFYLNDTQALAIYQDLLSRCAGYLVPRLVRELPDQMSKTPITLWQCSA